MKKLYAVLVWAFTLFLSQVAFGQWTATPQLITGTDTAANVYKIKGYGNMVFACSDKGLFASSDNGDTWTNLTFTKANTLGLAIQTVCVDAAAGKMYVGGDSTVFVSSDNGSTWSTTGMPMVDRIDDIEMAGDTVLVSWGSFTNGGIYYSTNNMSSVTAATAPNLPMTDFQFDGTTIFVGGKNGAYKSTDNGLTWALSGTGHPSPGKYLFMTQSGTSLFGGDAFGNGLYKSTDHGATWGKTDSTLLAGFCQVFSLTSAAGKILITVDGATCNSGAPVKISTDDGLTFTPYMTGLPVNYYPICGRNSAGTCFFVFNNNLKTPYKICSATGFKEHKGLAANVSLSPNPATDKITLSFKQATDIVNVKLLNTTGQLISQQQLKGLSKTDINTSNLPAGLYFVQITSTGASTTLKFIKE